MTADMDAKAVHQMRDEHKDCKCKNFKTNLNNLIGLVEKHTQQMKIDCIACGRGRALLIKLHESNPPQCLPCPAWNKFRAKTLLKLDVDNGKHLMMTPMELIAEREECRVFPLTIFRKHTHQKVDERASGEHHFAKKKHRAVWPTETAKQAEFIAAVKSD